MKPAIRSLGRIAVWGGLGGAINAWLCYAHLPVPIMSGGGIFGGPSPIEFYWTTIPGGFGHGAILALMSVLLAGRLAAQPLPIRVAAAAAAGWIAGYLSWIVLSTAMLLGEWPDILVWPLDQGWWQPWLHFGLAASLYIAGLSLRPNWPGPRLVPHLLCGIASGALGSLWWWIMSTPWYFSLIHGTIWGALVGYGVWICENSDVSPTPGS